MSDPSGTILYISSKTGEIIQAHSRLQRILAWCGPIIHWIYPRELILHRPLWKWVVIVLSCLGIIASLSGIISGFIRIKKRNSTYVSPYRNKWFRWHHYTGFVFGIVTFTWVFSGLLTMSPFGWTPALTITERENKKLQGGDLILHSFNQPPAMVFSSFSKRYAPVEIECNRYRGVYYYIFSDRKGKTRIAAASTVDQKIRMSFPLQMVIAGIQSLHQNSHVLKCDLIDQEDNYYYSKHNDSRLPVLRIKFTDGVWYYADPSTGAVVLKNDGPSRINRWLYHGLHSLDFFSLQHHRPLWDILIIILLLGGTAVAITGLVMSIRLIYRKYGPPA